MPKTPPLLYLSMFCLVLTSPSIAQDGPSFDCHLAKSQVEHAICSDPKLSHMDQALANAYKSAIASAVSAQAPTRESQRAWLQARSGICVAPADWAPLFRKPVADNLAACLTTLYQNRIQELEGGDPSSFSVYWRAESKTAYAITGDILLSANHLILGGGHEIQIPLVKTLPQTHAMNDSGFDDAATLQLFKIWKGSSWKLIGGNTLCGLGEVPTYLVLAQTDHNRSLSMAVFKGATEPRWEKPSLEDTHDLCGTYWYVRDTPKP
jgi:uncharacterized protein